MCLSIGSLRMPRDCSPGAGMAGRTVHFGPQPRFWRFPQRARNASDGARQSKTSIGPLQGSETAERAVQSCPGSRSGNTVGRVVSGETTGLRPSDCRFGLLRFSLDSSQRLRAWARTANPTPRNAADPRQLGTVSRLKSRGIYFSTSRFCKKLAFSARSRSLLFRASCPVWTAAQ